MLLLAALFSGCASMYETGSDQRDMWNITPLREANTGADEVAPVPGPEGLYFTSNREQSGEERDRLYLLPYAGGSFGAAERVRASSDEVKAGALAFVGGAAASSGELFFVECYRDDGIGDCDLIAGRLSADGRSIERMNVFPKPLNDVEWDHHPALSGDGRTLVFASERFGGKGGSDLWISTSESGEWSLPVNCGGIINTAGNEITPFLSGDGQELYFASDAHPGRGGFDIFVSRRAAEAWTAPEPIAAPFNSDADDIFLGGPVTADTVYFTSNRDGGSGGYDLYRAERKVVTPPPPPPKEKALVLRVQAKNSYTMQPIPAGVSISAAEDDLLLVEDRGSAETLLDLRKAYTVTGELAGFQSAVETLRFTDVDEVTRQSRDEGERMVITHDLLLVPIIEEERKIYAFTVEFDFNLFNIRPEEERKLDSVVILLAQFPNSTVVVSGHTDSVGTEIYNIKLGHSRAKEVSHYVQDWLLQKEVRLRNELEIRTYGESEPIAPNSSDEGRQRNRRVEIAIVRNQ
jgi:outer membrane protein OmpA-like peptidoglycan-associated protein